MFGENAAFDIGWAAGGEVDDDVEGLALVEGRLFGAVCRIGVWRKYCEPTENDKPSPRSTCHLVSPCIAIVKVVSP
jgi:hypothetical protein